MQVACLQSAYTAPRPVEGWGSKQSIACHWVEFHPAVTSIDLCLLGEMGLVSLTTFINIRVAPVRG